MIKFYSTYISTALLSPLINQIFLSIFLYICFTYKKIFKNIHQLNIIMTENKERLPKKLVKDINVFLRNKWDGQD